jgi:Mrp family chromosome partitioning ATPase/LPS O-antigen subunit length determinant protein (WzzB/FepE family)
VIEISFATTRPGASAAIVNAIAEQYIVDQLEARTETMRSAIQWLTGRVAEARQQVRDAEDTVEALRAELAGAAGQGLDITEQQLAALNTALSAARSRTAEVAARYQRLRAGLEDGADLAAISELRESALVTAYRAESAELAERLGTVSPNHPSAPRMRAALADLRAKVRAEAESIVAAVGTELGAARAQEASLTASVHALETKALGQSREEIRLRQLERDADASRLLYETMLKRLKETSEQVELQESNARILSPADPPLEPESARKHLIVAMAAAFGMLAGIGLVFLRDQLDDSFRSPQQIEDLTGDTVLATIPAIRRRRDAVKLLRERPSSSLAESVRNLRTSLLYANGAHPPTVVLFTSSVPREGKSTTALLTALTGRQMGKSAIIVDCDLRKPAPGGTELARVLDGTTPLETAIQTDAETGLHRLATRHGDARTSPADILASPEFAALVRRLAEHYDLVVLDAPPALVVTDARILSAISDTVVYAVRWGRTPRGAVLEGLRELRSVDAPIAGIVLTMIDEARAAKTTVDGYTYYKGRFRDYYRD